MNRIANIRGRNLSSRSYATEDKILVPVYRTFGL